MTLEELAERVADKLEYEEGVIESAKFEIEDPATPNGRKRNRFRDIKRAESKAIAFREILQLLLDNIQPEDTPDIESYMAARPNTF